MCAVWWSGINCTGNEGTEGGNIMENVTGGEGEHSYASISEFVLCCVCVCSLV